MRPWRQLLRRQSTVLAAAAVIAVGVASTALNRSPVSAHPASNLHAALAGLIDQDGPPVAPLTYSTGYVVNVRWDALQSGPDAALTPDNPIDTAIADVQSWNAAHPTDQRGLRIRLFTSSNSPGQPPATTWPQSLGGAPITVTEPAFGFDCAVGHYWTKTYESALADLQAKLAAKYDGNSVVREVVMGGASLCYPEPFLRYSWTTLTTAGDTLAHDEGSIKQEIAAYRVWKHVLVDMAFNPYDAPGSTGLTFTLQEMKAFRKAFGAQGVLMNDSLRASYASGTGNYQTMYAQMAAEKAPIPFQVAVPSKMGDPATTFNFACRLGAGSVEIMASAYEMISPTILSNAQTCLNANSR
jgi:hypothetical protein